MTCLPANEEQVKINRWLFPVCEAHVMPEAVTYAPAPLYGACAPPSLFTRKADSIKAFFPLFPTLLHRQPRKPHHRPQEIFIHHQNQPQQPQSCLTLSARTPVSYLTTDFYYYQRHPH